MSITIIFLSIDLKCDPQGYRVEARNSYKVNFTVHEAKQIIGRFVSEPLFNCSIFVKTNLAIFLEYAAPTSRLQLLGRSSKQRLTRRSGSMLTLDFHIFFSIFVRLWGDLVCGKSPLLTPSMTAQGSSWRNFFKSRCTTGAAYNQIDLLEERLYALVFINGFIC
jgi:hypothetical protein